MKSFRSQDMQKQAAAVQEAAMREPVLITYHDRPRLVVMSIEEYERLRERALTDVNRAVAPAPNRTPRDFLIAYSRQEITRSEAMDGAGIDRSEVGRFATLMRTEKMPWPPVDRERAEREADDILALLDGEGA